jgi:hypothetical protein
MEWEIGDDADDDDDDNDDDDDDDDDDDGDRGNDPKWSFIASLSFWADCDSERDEDQLCQDIAGNTPLHALDSEIYRDSSVFQ